MRDRFNLTRPIRPGFQRRRPTISTTGQPTTSSTTAISRPTRIKSHFTMKPFRKYLPRTTTHKPIESQATTPGPNNTRNRLFSRRPHTTPPHKDQTPDTSSYHEPSTQHAEEVTGLRDLAIALNYIQHAPVPSDSNTEFVLEYPESAVRNMPRATQRPRGPQRGANGVPSRTRTRPKIVVNEPIFTTLTTFRTTSSPHTIRYISSNEPPTPPDDQLPFYRVTSPSIPLRHQTLDDDFYLTGISQLPAHSKVLIHSSGVIECLDQGSFPHPVSCRKFISCAKMDNAKILGWEYTCPKNLSFDPIGGMCNWSAGLGCDEK